MLEIKEKEKTEQGRGREQETEGKKKRTLRQVKDYIFCRFHYIFSYKS